MGNDALSGPPSVFLTLWAASGCWRMGCVVGVALLLACRTGRGQRGCHLGLCAAAPALRKALQSERDNTEEEEEVKAVS